ncbi:protein-tyrosine phosphatase-like protein [Phellopilus nigrolimitatus]|nr:protein-tyrosine phosphatase-like protein [Phellopilus nigrolimitatus]
MSRQKSAKVTADANLVYGDFLYVGHASAASNTAFLEHEHITDVVSIGKKPGELPPGVQGKYIGFEDSTSVTRKEFDDVCYEAGRIIDSVRKHNEEAGKSKKKRKVLVHCSAGISRSPTIVIAYLMKYQSHSLLQALARVWSRRPKVVPNVSKSFRRLQGIARSC